MASSGQPPSSEVVESVAVPRNILHYDASFPDLTTGFIECCIEKSRSLDMICRHRALKPKEGGPYIPSWVSLISKSAFGEPQAALQGRSNGDSLVGMPGRKHQKIYNASAGLEAFAEFGRYGEIEISNTGTGRRPECFFVRMQRPSYCARESSPR